MFSVPQARRVRRSDLDSPSSSRSTSPDTELDAALRARLREVVGVSFDADESLDAAVRDHASHDAVRGFESEAAPNDEGQSTFAFNLFKPNLKARPGSHSNANVSAVASEAQVRLSPVLGDQRSLQQSTAEQRRPLSHYIQPEWTEEEQRRFASSAAGADYIVANTAKLALDWNGTARPWRVINLPFTALTRGAQYRVSALSAPPIDTGGVTALAVSTIRVEETTSQRRCRKSKKARLRIRRRLSRKKEKEAKADATRLEEERKAADKAAYERDKKSKLNRKKQLKKREKQRGRKHLDEPTSQDGDLHTSFGDDQLSD